MGNNLMEKAKLETVVKVALIRLQNGKLMNIKSNHCDM